MKVEYRLKTYGVLLCLLAVFVPTFSHAKNLVDPRKPSVTKPLVSAIKKASKHEGLSNKFNIGLPSASLSAAVVVSPYVGGAYSKIVDVGANLLMPLYYKPITPESNALKAVFSNSSNGKNAKSVILKNSSAPVSNNTNQEKNNLSNNSQLSLAVNNLIYRVNLLERKSLIPQNIINNTYTTQVIQPSQNYFNNIADSVGRSDTAISNQVTNIQNIVNNIISGGVGTTASTTNIFDTVQATSTTGTSTFAGNIVSGGNITANTFFGDGSNLTGITSFSTSTTRSVFSAGSNLAYDITNGIFSLASSTVRSMISSAATGLAYDNNTGVITLASGYIIPTTASTTEWHTALASTTLLSSFYTTPSSRITAGTGLAWSGNTLENSGVLSIGGLTGAVATSSLGIVSFSTTTARSVLSGAELISYDSNTGAFSLATSTIWNLFSTTATGLAYDNNTGVITLASGYIIPTTASTTEWANKVSSQWVTNGSNIGYSSGNVGIGTSTPAEKLVVNGNIISTGTLYFGTSTTASISHNTLGQMTLASAGTNQDIVIDPSGTGGLLFEDGTSFSTKLIPGAGRFSIGTEDQAGTTYATIGGSSKSGFSVSTLGGYWFTESNTSSDGIGGGTVTGLGRSTTGVLEINNGTTGTWRDLIVRNLSMGTTSTSSTFTLQGNAGVDPFTIASSTGTSMLTLLKNGNLGVGTNAPSFKLEVNQATGANSALRVSGLSGGAFILGYSNTTGGVVNGDTAHDVVLRLDNGAGRFHISNGTAPRFTLTSAGDVGIGTSSPEARLDIRGASVNSGTSTNHYRNVATYSSTGTPTGTIKITLPKQWTNTNLNITIRGFNYTANENMGDWEVFISGRNYSLGAWHGYGAELRGKAPFSSVRLATDGTKNIILLGATTTAWSMPNIVVTDVITSGAAPSSWGTGWSIGVITDETGISAISTPTVSQSGKMLTSSLATSVPISTDTTFNSFYQSNGGQYSRWGIIDQGTGIPGRATYLQGGFTSSALYYNLLLNPLGGDVGIGTTTPGAKLDVWGNLNVTSGATPTLFVNTSTGKVGIGTSTPAEKLVVNGNIISTGTLYFGTSTTASISHNTLGQMTLASAGTNQDIVIDPSGTGGLLFEDGTSFSTKLIPGAGRFSIGREDQAGTTYATIGGSSKSKSGFSVSTLGGYWFTESNTSSDGIGGGTVTGLGRSTTGVLEINNGTTGTWRDLIVRNLSMGTTSTSSTFTLQGNAAANPLTIASSTGSVLLTLLKSGNLGIGTTTPSAQLTTTGTVQFAAFGAGALQTDASGNLTVSSDERLKDIQGNFVSSLEQLENIVPIMYKWKPETGYDTQGVYTGFSAQNIQESIPEAVTVDKNGYLALQDRPILATVVNAIKDLKKSLDAVSDTFKNIISWFSTDGDRLNVQGMICVDDTCVTKDQFKMMLIRNADASYYPNHNATSSGNTGGGSSSGDTTTTTSTDSTISSEGATSTPQGDTNPPQDQPDTQSDIVSPPNDTVVAPPDPTPSTSSESGTAGGSSEAPVNP